MPRSSLAHQSDSTLANLRRARLDSVLRHHRHALVAEADRALDLVRETQRVDPAFDGEDVVHDVCLGWLEGDGPLPEGDLGLFHCLRDAVLEHVEQTYALRSPV